MAAALLAAAGYGIAFSIVAGAATILVALPCVCLLARVGTARRAFYIGLIAGMGMYVPHLAFFWKIFGPKTLLLWLITGSPVGVFVLLLNHAHRRLGETWAMWLTPMLWMAVEYFRSELYQLRFAWLLPGQVATFLPGVRALAWVGVYGAGFLYVTAAAMVVGRGTVMRAIGVAAALALGISMYVWRPAPVLGDAPLHVAGVQLEFPTDAQAADALERLAMAHPEAQVLVMSEYTFDGPVPAAVREVVRRHGRYLIAGGKRWMSDRQFYDTAFVVGPDGRDVFEQGKSVPVQFMDDGLPTAERRVWESPWGKIGIAVCYDVSYARVMDDLVRKGARGLIIPTMDVTHWGEYERRMLHGRMAPIRSAEYGIPIFSVWSSGVSQLTDRYGRVIATAGYPGQGEMIAGPLDLGEAGRVPVDRVVAMGAVVGTGVFIAYLVIGRTRRRRS